MGFQLVMGVPQSLDGLFHGKSYSNGSPISGKPHFWNSIFYLLQDDNNQEYDLWACLKGGIPLGLLKR